VLPAIVASLSGATREDVRAAAMPNAVAIDSDVPRLKAAPPRGIHTLILASVSCAISTAIWTEAVGWHEVSMIGES
jgi:hypothetical protein